MKTISFCTDELRAHPNEGMIFILLKLEEALNESGLQVKLKYTNIAHEEANPFLKIGTIHIKL
jgi:hypothetical protein